VLTEGVQESVFKEVLACPCILENATSFLMSFCKTYAKLQAAASSEALGRWSQLHVSVLSLVGEKKSATSTIDTPYGAAEFGSPAFTRAFDQFESMSPQSTPQKKKEKKGRAR